MSCLPPIAFWPFGDAAIVPAIRDIAGTNDLTRYLFFNDCTAPLRLGRNSGTGIYAGQQALAHLKGWGLWRRSLTSGEKAALAGGEYYPFATTPSLLVGLGAYYLLDEAGGSATYTDQLGANHLTATGTTVQTTGPNGGADKATQLTAGVYLTKTSPTAAARSGNTTITIAGWVKLDSKPAGGFAQQVFWGQLVNDTAQSGFNVYFDPTADRFCMDFNGGDGQQLSQGAAVVDATLGSPALGTWYLPLAEYNAATGVGSLQINNGTATTLADLIQPVVVTGKVGSGSQFRANPALSFASRTSGWDTPPAVVGNSHIWRAANSVLSIGNNSKCVWGWFKAANTSNYQTLAGFFDSNVVADTDWVVQISGGQLYFVFGRNGTNYCNVAFTDTASWHLIVCWFDKVAGKIFMDLDHGASTANATFSGTAQVSTLPLRFGSDVNSGLSPSGFGHQFTGALNLWGIGNGTPNQLDLDTLWNNGNGYLYDPLAVTGNRGLFRLPGRPGRWL